MARTDEELIEALIQEDAEALRELLPRLRPCCLRVLRDRYGHLDSAQAEILADAESLLFDWSLGPRARERLPRGESLGALAYRLVAQVARRMSRQRRQQLRLERELAADLDPPSVPPPAPTFGTGAVEAAIAELPENHRQVIVGQARYQLGVGPPLAEVLSTTVESARVRLHKARGVLVGLLGDKGLVDPREKNHV